MQHPLLHRLIDYAGLFPPAELALAEAFREYTRHRAEEQAWMLGRFICPQSRLPGLGGLIVEAGSDIPIDVSLIVPPSDDLRSRMNQAHAAIEQFEAQCSGRGRVSLMECRVSEPMEAGDIVDALSPLADRTIFLEWSIKTPFDALQAARASGLQQVGAKIRCGGVVPEAFPEVDAVAAFIVQCIRRGIPMKATAGLHHPVRHFRDGVMMHGFLNVFGAASLLAAGALPETDTRAVVAEEDPAAFGLERGGFRWRDVTVTAEQVTQARRLGIEGFGSCSFSEPLEDLDGQGWFGLHGHPSKTRHV